MKISVHCLGSGDAFGSGGRFNACYYVRADNFNFLLDCGASSLIAMKKFNVDPQSIDLIVISHLHGDHFGGVPFLIRETQISTPRIKPLTVAGPHGIKERIENALEVFFPSASQTTNPFPIQYFEYMAEKILELPPLKIEAYPVIHSIGTSPYALRLTIEKKVIAYSGDTEWTDKLIKAAFESDLFLSEAYTFNSSRKNHLSIKDLLNHQFELSSKRIVMVHMGEEVLKNLSIVPFEYANDGEIIIV